MTARLLSALFAALAEFSRHGFAPFGDEWRRYDYLAGRPVTVRAGSVSYSGTAAGISAGGALLLDNGTDIATVIAGDVSLRQAA
jgi:BirA family biotin operon repressor/biotin-[acetyl-CoA-carboxylase] ligase